VVGRIPSSLVKLTLVAAVAGGCTARQPAPSAPLSERPSVSPEVRDPSSAAEDPWQLVATGSAATATAMRGVTVASSGFVAVGSSGQAGETAMAWSSADGVTWSSEEIVGRGTSPHTVVPWGDRFLAIGRGSSSRCAHPDELDVWLRDADGAWAEAPFDEAFCAGGHLVPVIQGERAWLIGQGFAEVPTALESIDGLTWMSRGRALGDVQVVDAVAEPPGLWVSDRAAATGAPEVRASVDGRQWHAVALPEVGIADPPTFLTVDRRVALLARTAAGRVLLTPDGDGWRSTAATGLDGLELLLVRPAGAGAVAIATDEAGRFTLLATDDGATWRTLPMPVEAGPEPLIWDVAVGHGTVVAVGAVPPPAGSTEIAAGALWSAPESSLAR
jgi:hypothetical protein